MILEQLTTSTLNMSTTNNYTEYKDSPCKLQSSSSINNFCQPQSEKNDIQYDSAKFVI